MIVRAFFADGNLSAGLAKANAGLQQLGRSGPGARAGLRAVEIGARTLAFQAAGLTGGMGQLARGFLLFGGGSALMLGAVAGIGAVALAYRHFTKAAREAHEAQEKLNEEIRKGLLGVREQRISPIQQLERRGEAGRGRVTELGVEMIDLRARIAEENRNKTIGFQARIVGLEEQLNKKFAERAQLMNALHAVQATITDELRKQNAETEKLAQKERERIARLVHLGTFARPTPSVSMGAAPPEAAALVQAAVEGGRPLAMTGVGGAPGISPMREAADEAARSSAAMRATVVANFGAMAAAAIVGSHNMAVAVISAFTNIAAQLPGISKDPLLGSIIGAAGVLLGAIFGGKPAKVHVVNADDIARAIQGGVSLVQVQLAGSGLSMDEIMALLAERTRTDDIQRLPPRRVGR